MGADLKKSGAISRFLCNSSDNDDKSSSSIETTSSEKLNDFKVINSLCNMIIMILRNSMNYHY